MQERKVFGGHSCHGRYEVDPVRWDGIVLVREGGLCAALQIERGRTKLRPFLPTLPPVYPL